MNKKFNVLMVCLGNICRSPTAQSVFESMVVEAGLDHLIEVDSAGTSNWHIGKAPDARSQAAAAARGYDLTSQRGRQVAREDFENFHYILAMDHSNLSDLQRMQPPGSQAQLALLLDYGSARETTEVPDPYHGGSAGFELVIDLIEDACRDLLRHIRAEHLND